MRFAIDNRIRFFLNFKENQVFKLGWVKKDGENYFNGEKATCGDCIHSYEWEFGVIGCRKRYTGDAVGMPKQANAKALAHDRSCFRGRI